MTKLIALKPGNESEFRKAGTETAVPAEMENLKFIVSLESGQHVERNVGSQMEYGEV